MKAYNIPKSEPHLSSSDMLDELCNEDIFSGHKLNQYFSSLQNSVIPCQYIQQMH